MEFLIYDGIIAGLLILFVWLGWRKGLLLSLCGLVVAIAAFMGAGFLADTMDAPVADAITPRLEESINKQLALHYDELSDKSPIDALRDMGGLFSWAADAMEDAQESAVGTAIGDLAAQAAGFVAQRIAHNVIFVLSFLVLYILLTLLLHGLDLVAKLPGLKFCNGLGGGIIGFFKGAIFVFVATSALMLSSLRPGEEVLESSYLLKFFVESNPILTLFLG